MRKLLSGSRMFDSFIGPLEQGCLLLVSSYSGIGKTVFSAHFASLIAVNSSTPVIYAAPLGSYSHICVLFKNALSNIYSQKNEMISREIDNNDSITGGSNLYIVIGGNPLYIYSEKELSVQDVIKESQNTLNDQVGLIVLDGLEKLNNQNDGRRK